MSNRPVAEVLLPLPFDHGFSYFVPDDLVIKIGDVVEVQDVVINKQTWNIGKIIKLCKTIYIPPKRVKCITYNEEFSKHLDVKLEKDTQVFAMAVYYANKLFRTQLKILGAEYRWDNLNITLRYTTFTTDNLSIKDLINRMKIDYNGIYIQLVYVAHCKNIKCS